MASPRQKAAEELELAAEKLRTHASKVPQRGIHDRAATPREQDLEKLRTDLLCTAKLVDYVADALRRGG